jgi:hypothetical protein
VNLVITIVAVGGGTLGIGTLAWGGIKWFYNNWTISGREKQARFEAFQEYLGEWLREAESASPTNLEIYCRGEKPRLKIKAQRIRRDIKRGRRKKFDTAISAACSLTAEEITRGDGGDRPGRHVVRDAAQSVLNAIG